MLNESYDDRKGNFLSFKSVSSFFFLFNIRLVSKNWSLLFVLFTVTQVVPASVVRAVSHVLIGLVRVTNLA